MAPNTHYLQLEPMKIPPVRRRRSWLSILFFAILLLTPTALVITALRPIPELDQPLPPLTGEPINVRQALELAAQRTPLSSTLDEAQINAYIAEKQGELAPGTRAPRVALHEDYVQIYAVVTPMGVELHTTIKLAIVEKESMHSVEGIGGHIGQLPIHPQLLRIMIPWYRQVAENFQSELEMFTKIGAVKFSPGKMELAPAEP